MNDFFRELNFQPIKTDEFDGEFVALVTEYELPNEIPVGDWIPGKISYNPPYFTEYLVEPIPETGWYFVKYHICRD